MYNTETKATLGTRQCFTIQRHRQHWAQDNVLQSLDCSCLTVPLVFSKASFVRHCLVPNVACVSGLFMLDSPFGYRQHWAQENVLQKKP
jgi:hypothetical protein